MCKPFQFVSQFLKFGGIKNYVLLEICVGCSVELGLN